MTQSMIERVARELCTIAGQDPDELAYPVMGFQTQVRSEPRSPSDRVPTWMRFRPAAYQVISAMREPTSAMKICIPETDRDGFDQSKVRPAFAWQVMIDAALVEKV